jgi:hypothetical protein
MLVFREISFSGIELTETSCKSLRLYKRSLLKKNSATVSLFEAPFIPKMFSWDGRALVHCAGSISETWSPVPSVPVSFILFYIYWETLLRGSTGLKCS